MEQSPFWESNSLSENQEISHFFLKQKVHYRFQEDPPLPLSSARSILPTPFILFITDPV